MVLPSSPVAHGWLAGSARLAAQTRHPLGWSIVVELESVSTGARLGDLTALFSCTRWQPWTQLKTSPNAAWLMPGPSCKSTLTRVMHSRLMPPVWPFPTPSFCCAMKPVASAFNSKCSSPTWLRLHRSEEHTSELQSHQYLVCR